MGYCWIKKENFYNNVDIQNMLYFLNYHKNDKEYTVFMKYISEHSNVNDANAIKHCVSECYYEEFDSYDSDVCEQFISAFEKLFITNIKYNNHTPTSQFIVICKKDNEYGVIDIEDFKVDYFDSDKLIEIVRNGINIDGVSLDKIRAV